MDHAQQLFEVATSRCEQALPHSLAVLIQVPAVKHNRSRRYATAAPVESRSRHHAVRGPRRRLRRRVRLAGCALLVLSPIASACTLGWSNQPTRIMACSIADTGERGEGSDVNTSSGSNFHRASGTGQSGGSPSTVVLSSEPAAGAPEAQAVVPVIFPGYVLPDDSLEDRAHEGS
jgi:hypothetical protein